MKKVYLTIGTDIIHHGHINVIEKARELGEVTVGILTDEVMASYKRYPLLEYDQRKKVIENIKGVENVVRQEELDYTPTLKELKPDYVVHGEDWKTGPQQKIREKVIETLEEWGGELVEVEYTKDVSLDKLDEKIEELGTTPDERRKKLRKLIEKKDIVRIIEAHNGLTGLIAEKTKFPKEDKIESFDGMWVSSLCDSTVKGKPDIELVDETSRINTINEILEVTTKTIILDGDTGGKVEHFVYTVKTLERIGVSAVIIEDKIGLKRNSLFGTEVEQKQDTIENFTRKISEGKKAQVTDDFMIIARIESLILDAGLDDALERAEAYIDAGVDAVMIHSKDDDPDDILAFFDEYEDFEYKVPVVVVPTTYCQITEEELIEAGANVVIYANHLLRSAYPAMKKAAESILEHNRAKEADEKYCMGIRDILTLIPGGK